MSEDIRRMTAELAADPASLVFLELGEALRRRGQLGSALKVALAGRARYEALADAHDLCARVYSDLGDGEAAFDAWMDALQRDPSHIGAHKGLGFLYFRGDDPERALRHLEMARARSDDPGLDVAITRVRAVRDASAAAPAAAGLPFALDEEPADDAPHDEDLFAGFEGSRDGMLLLDANGLRLGGGLRNESGQDVADAVAAHLAGVSREAARAARLLSLGDWQALSAESEGANLHLSAPTADTVLLTARDAGVPVGRLAVIAERAAAAARRWLEQAG